MKIAAIERAPENSPGMVDNDRAILAATAEQLRAMGHNVEFTKTVVSGNSRFDAIIHMSRTKEILRALADTEKCGTRIYNTPQAVERCSRSTFIGILAQKDIPQPTYSIIEGNDAPREGYPMWLKRGDGWSCHSGDVAFVIDHHEAIEAIEEMHKRGIKEIITSPHIVGDIVKFYGVSGSEDTPTFFRFYYPDADKTKFQLEKHNGECRRYPFDKETLQRIAFAAARAIGLDIFGGDCIVSPTGEIHIIDINDFPSFKVCRDEAAAAIAKLINSKTEER